MSRTIRWYQKPKNMYVFSRDRIPSWKYINPFYYKHDHKLVRIEMHRIYRHENKLRIKKGMDILIESKTRGWLSW